MAVVSNSGILTTTTTTTKTFNRIIKLYKEEN